MSDAKQEPRPSWMRDIRRQLQRELLIKQSQPGAAIQSKVHFALQLRKARESAIMASLTNSSTDNANDDDPRHDSRKHSPAILPFTNSEVTAMFTAPSFLKPPLPMRRRGSIAPGIGGISGHRPTDAVAFTHTGDVSHLAGTSQSPVTVHQPSKLVDDLTQVMARRGTNEIVRQMMVRYVESNPQSIESMRKELREERLERQREQQSAVLKHEHVFPEELMFASRVTNFPKGPMVASSKDLISTRSGASSKHLRTSSPIDADKTSPDETEGSASSPHAKTPDANELRLEPILTHQPPSSGALLPPITKRSVAAWGHQMSVLGDHLPTYVCGGIPVTFDHMTIASLTTQNGALTESIVGQQDEDYGELLLVPLDEEIASVRTLHAPPHTSVRPKVSCGRNSPSVADVHRKKAALDPRYPLSVEELETIMRSISSMGSDDIPSSLKPTNHAGDAVGRHSPSPLQSHEVKKDKSHHHHHSRLPIEVPEGMLKELLREVDDGDDVDANQNGFHPHCLVCHSYLMVQQKRRVNPSALTSPSHAAMETLNMWKALHQLSMVDANSDLLHQLERRDACSKVVMQNRKALAQVTHRAKSDAEGWLRSRSSGSGHTGSQHSGNAPSIWDEPSHEMEMKQQRWASCVLFWERLRQFLIDFLQAPISDAQADILDRLRTTLEACGALSIGAMLIWLRSCGPSLTRVRENYRILTFVRCSFQVPHAALLAWSRLPSVRQVGFELVTD